MSSSSSDLAISVRGLSKRYEIVHGASGVPTFRDVLVEKIRHPFRRARRDAFWALRDVNLEVRAGDVVGIIGRNGAGKSTLLKLLSRITEPTEGEIDLYGRVGSLLEVGTGFHPELSGRENVYLNGAILGMRRREIDRRFDAIVDFAGVEKFIDTPVKRYSSGMYVRLAFAVAAHLEAEVLIVDEVLAVGDAEFQKKCLGKMEDVSRSGRTVVFVSHNMAAVANLCRSAVVMDAGRVAVAGPARDAIDQYMAMSNRKLAEQNGNLAAHRPHWARAAIRSARVIDARGNTTSHFPLGSDISFEVTFDVEGGQPIDNPSLGIVLDHATFGTVGGVNMMMTGTRMEGGPHSRGVMRCTLRRPPLLQGQYRVSLWLTDGNANVDMLDGFLSFTLEETDVYQSGQAPYPGLGVMYLDPEWQFSASVVDASRALDVAVG